MENGLLVTIKVKDHLNKDQFSTKVPVRASVPLADQLLAPRRLLAGRAHRDPGEREGQVYHKIENFSAER